MLALLVLLSVVSVVFGLLALPLATWVQAHHEVLEGFLNCTIAEVKLANETVEAELPLECRELAWDDCQGCDGDEDGGDPKLDKECRYCGCQVVYVLESIKPSVKGALDKCCQTFKEDDGTKFLLSPCHDIVDNFTGSFAEGAKECKKKGIHSDVQKPVMLLSSASATMARMAWAMELSKVLRESSHRMLFLAPGLLFLGLAAVGSRWRRAPGRDASDLSENLLA